MIAFSSFKFWEWEFRKSSIHLSYRLSYVTETCWFISISEYLPWEVEMIRIDIPKETKRKQANRWINPASYCDLRKKITLGSYPNPDLVIIHLYRNGLDFLELFIFTDMSTSLPVDHETLIMLANNECDYLKGYWRLFFFINSFITVKKRYRYTHRLAFVGYLKGVCKILFPMQVGLRVWYIKKVQETCF